MIKKILVPLDGSKLAECVLADTEDLAKKLDAEVALISVTNSVQGYWPIEDARRPSELHMVEKIDAQKNDFLYPQATCSQEEHATNYLNAAAKGLEEKGVKVIKEVICGKTAQEIIYYAERNHSDLIIMSTHGRSGLSKLTHGSITEKVLKLARIPVMVIRPIIK